MISIKISKSIMSIFFVKLTIFQSCALQIVLASVSGSTSNINGIKIVDMPGMALETLAIRSYDC